MLSESTEQQNSTDFSKHRKFQNLAALQIYLGFYHTENQSPMCKCTDLQVHQLVIITSPTYLQL